MSTKYTDPDTRCEHGSAAALVNSYIERFSQIVSEAIGQEVRFPALDADGYSHVSRGTATVGINVLEEAGNLLLLCRIMPVPSQGQEAFFRRLLELNYLATGDAAFALDRGSDAVCLRAMRPVEGLSYVEFEALLDTVATVADDMDDALLEEFGEG